MCLFCRETISEKLNGGSNCAVMGTLSAVLPMGALGLCWAFYILYPGSQGLRCRV